MEQFDLYDSDKKITGKVMTRGEKVPDGLYRYVVHAIIFNSKGELLIQKRADCKGHWPSLWDVSVGGCVIKGETQKQAMQRELKEELGLDYDFSNTRPFMTFAFEGGFDDWYYLVMDVDPSKLHLQKEEVSDAKYASLDEIKKLITEGKFIKYQDYFFDFIFETAGKKDIFKE